MNENGKMDENKLKPFEIGNIAINIDSTEYICTSLLVLETSIQYNYKQSIIRITISIKRIGNIINGTAIDDIR